LERKAEVVVIGAGSTGTSIFYHLAKSGAKRPLLVDKAGQTGAGQTSRSTALIRTHYSVETVARMALRSYAYFKSFDETMGGRSAGFVETGLLICADESAKAPLLENLAMLRRLGIPTDEVDRSRAREIEPLLDTGPYAAVVYEPNMGYAEPSGTAAAFASAGAELGGELILNTRATAIARKGNAYVVSTGAGEIEAEKVVLATGVWSGPLFSRIGVKVPVRAVRHPVASFKRPPGYRGKRPVILDFARSAYYKPEGEFMMFVGSLERELDERGAEVDPDSYREDIEFDEVGRFSECLAAAVPLMGRDGMYKGGYAGIYDVTPDQQPVIDELSEFGYEGLFALVGLSGHGFKLCPEFGRIMASMVLGDPVREYDISLFRLKRFEEGKLLASKYSVGTIG
jgi:glycine/D-amino acid oxidase-like deaminating enzyme